jgi:hypothetical protein
MSLRFSAGNDRIGDILLEIILHGLCSSERPIYLVAADKKRKIFEEHVAAHEMFLKRQ